MCLANTSEREDHLVTPLASFCPALHSLLSVTTSPVLLFPVLCRYLQMEFSRLANSKQQKKGGNSSEGAPYERAHVVTRLSCAAFPLFGGPAPPIAAIFACPAFPTLLSHITADSFHFLTIKLISFLLFSTAFGQFRSSKASFVPQWDFSPLSRLSAVFLHFQGSHSQNSFSVAYFHSNFV